METQKNSFPFLHVGEQQRATKIKKKGAKVKTKAKKILTISDVEALPNQTIRVRVLKRDGKLFLSISLNSFLKESYSSIQLPLICCNTLSTALIKVSKTFKQQIEEERNNGKQQSDVVKNIATLDTGVPLYEKKPSRKVKMLG